MRIVITGTQGLGRVVAEHLAHNHKVTMLSRSEHLLTDDYDAVIHCAGGGLGLKDPMASSLAFYQLFMANLGRQVEVNRQVLPKMIERKQGYIVHVCSIASGEACGSVGYNTMKAALAAYVRSLGREMAPHGVVVTGINPGGFQCPGNAMERLEKNNPEGYAQFLKKLPRGYMGKAEELLPLIDLLISPAASMMGGSVIPIDAGEGSYYS